MLSDNSIQRDLSFRKNREECHLGLEGFGLCFSVVLFHGFYDDRVSVLFLSGWRRAVVCQLHILLEEEGSVSFSVK